MKPSAGQTYCVRLPEWKMPKEVPLPQAGRIKLNPAEGVWVKEPSGDKALHMADLLREAS